MGNQKMIFGISPRYVEVAGGIDSFHHSISGLVQLISPTTVLGLIGKSGNHGGKLPIFLPLLGCYGFVWRDGCACCL